MAWNLEIEKSRVTKSIINKFSYLNEKFFVKKLKTTNFEDIFIVMMSQSRDEIILISIYFYLILAFY